MARKSTNRRNYFTPPTVACVAGDFVWRARKWARKLQKRARTNGEALFPLGRSPLTLRYKIATYGGYSYWSVDYHFYMATQFTPSFSFCKAEAVPPDVE